MDHPVALTAVVGTFVAVLFAVVATSGEVELAQQPPQISWDLGFDPPEESPLRTPNETEFVAGGQPGTASSNAVATVMQYILLATMIVLVAFGATRAWRNRPRLIWRRPRQPDDFEAMVDIAAAVTAAADDQRAALQRGEARNAIVECWVRLELLVTSVGFRPDPAETAGELTARVLGEYAIDPDAILDLSSLYREARFSAHPLGEAERAEAIEALDAIHHGLWRHRGTAATT